MADGGTVKRNDLGIYDAVAAQWWSDEIRWVRTLRNLVPARLAYFDRFVTWPGAAVLDVGCAGGFMAEAMAGRGAAVSGIDPSTRAIAAARSHARSEGLEIDYRTGVGEALPYEADRFDIAVCVDVLEHVDSVETVVTEIHRVLKPGGWFLFDTLNRNPLAAFTAVTLAENVLRLLPRGTHDPALFIRPAELRAHLEAAGFEPGRFTGLGPRGITRRGDLLFGRLPGTAILYMGTARKPV